MMTLFWILVGLLAALAVMGALGIWGMYSAYIHGEEFTLEYLEKKHGLRDD